MKTKQFLTYLQNFIPIYSLAFISKYQLKTLSPHWATEVSYLPTTKFFSIIYQDSATKELVFTFAVTFKGLCDQRGAAKPVKI